jgi:PIN domain nuclease of toxin-antitoxin system
VSIASAWELAIKISLGKLDFVGGSNAFLSEIEENGIEIIGIDGAYIHYVESLPFLHRDPFDRILISTANTEKMIMLTADEAIHQYDVSWKW